MGSVTASPNTLSGIDERNQERWLLIQYLRVFDANTNQLLGHVVNVTTEGIRVISEKPLAIDCEYHLKMEIPQDGEADTEIRLDARSVWNNADVDPFFHNTGFQFIRCPEESVNAIATLIEKLKQLQISKYSTPDIED